MPLNNCSSWLGDTPVEIWAKQGAIVLTGHTNIHKHTLGAVPTEMGQKGKAALFISRAMHSKKGWSGLWEML